MKSLKQLLTTLTLLAFTTLTSHAKEITLMATKNTELKADYFASKIASKRAVLMLHQCNYNRTMYNNIGKQLAKQGIHALSLDFRGFGDSTNAQYNIEHLTTLPRDEQRKAFRKMAQEWPTDVQLAYDFLKNKAQSDKNIGVIGASCGGSQAITLAQNSNIKALSFLSSGQSKTNIERYQNSLANKPTLIIAAEEDGNTYTSAQAIFKVATHKHSQLVSYKGDEHGYPLFETDPHLASNIVQWFANQL